MNILSQKIAAIEKHISTHSERSVEDIAAVTTLKDFFKYDGKISSLKKIIMSSLNLSEAAAQRSNY